MDIRRAGPDDVPAVAKIHIDAWLVAYRGLVSDAYLERLNAGRPTERHRESLTQSLEETYFAWEADAAVGFVTLGSCRDENLDAKATGEIGHSAVPVAE